MDSHTIKPNCHSSLLTTSVSALDQTLIKLNISFMEATREQGSGLQFPPGFRFHPSDEELIVHYLQNKVTSRPLPATIIAEVDLYKYNPWELPDKALFGDDGWYFFSPREKKYPNGARPNRAAGVGYWKATATDKPIFSCSGSKRVGVKKALVFYTGRAPRGLKTDWMMNEYRLIGATTRLKGSMRLDDWVLCRVRLKGNSMLRHTWEVHETRDTEMAEYLPKIEEACPMYLNNIYDKITDRLYKDFLPLLSDQSRPPTIETISGVSCQGSKNGNNFTTTTYEDGFEKVNSPVTGSSSDTYFKPMKRKPSEENVYENILLSNKKLNVDYRGENFPLGKAFPNADINYYSQLQDVYPNLSDPVIDYLELNQLHFTDKIIFDPSVKAMVPHYANSQTFTDKIIFDPSVKAMVPHYANSQTVQHKKF